jgi:hypothetical protein
MAKSFDLGGGVFFKSIRGENPENTLILGRPGKPGCVAVSRLEGVSSLRYFDLTPEGVAAAWVYSYPSIASHCKENRSVPNGESWGLAAVDLLTSLDEGQGTYW